MSSDRRVMGSYFSTGNVENLVIYSFLYFHLSNTVGSK